MDRRRPLLVNEGEVRTDGALRDAAAALGYGVHAKVRVADALSIDRSGLTDEQYGYALRSHFDWLVTDTATVRAEFAVEFDGASHEDDKVLRRDALKNEICRALGLPLLRVSWFGLRPTIRDTVLWYLVESWALWRGWCEAQEKGQIPDDEIFEPWLFLEPTDDHTLLFRDMAAPARGLVDRLWRTGAVTLPGPSYAYRSDPPGDPGHVAAYAWVPTADGHLVIGRARISAYSFPAVLDVDLADDLAHLDLAGRLSRWTEGDTSVLEEPGTLPAFGYGWSGGGVFVDPPAA